MDSMAAMFIVTGAPGAGKTTVARQLAQRFGLSLHIPTDELRSWVVNGRAEPIPVMTPAAIQQLSLAREVAGSMAALYRKNGFTVIVDDVLSTDDVDAIVTQSDQGALYKIFLCPALEYVLARNSERYPQFDLAKWQPIIAKLHQDLCRQNTPETGWIVLDSSHLRIEQTVDAILQAIQPHSDAPTTR